MSWVACLQISTSNVARVGPPRMRITPNELNVNRNTIDVAAAIAGARRGSVTLVQTRHLDAPRTRAASARRGSRCAQNVPTVRTTTA